MRPKVGDIVVVTERHGTNMSKPGMIVELTEDDHSRVPYCVKDVFDLYNWSDKYNWCEDVRLATEEDLQSIGKGETYEIY